jgi:hypothetical protein
MGVASARSNSPPTTFRSTEMEDPAARTEGERRCYDGENLASEHFLKGGIHSHLQNVPGF